MAEPTATMESNSEKQEAADSLSKQDTAADSPAKQEAADSPAKQEAADSPADSPAESTTASSPPVGPILYIPKGYVRLAGWRLVVVEICLCLGLLLSIVDASIVAAALVHIEEDFNNFLTTNWVVLSYIITEMGFAIMWARGSDIIGRKWLMLVAWIIFVAFSLASGLAKTVNQLIVFRALQGFGGSGLYSLVNVLVPEITPPKHFGTMTAAAGAVFTLSSVLGPILGGVISADASWRWIFFLNVPAGIVTAAVLVLVWPSPLPLEIMKWRATFVYQKTTFQMLTTHIDFVGSVLLLGCTVLLVFGMQQGGSAALEWSSPAIIASFTISGACGVGLLLWILYLHYSKNTLRLTAILPWHMITQRILGLSLLNTLLTGFPLYITLIAIPQRYQLVDGLSSSDASIKMMPLLFSSAVGSTISGFCNRTKNTTFWTLLIASCLMTLGCGLLSSIPVSTKVQASLYGYEVIYGLGLGMTFSSAATIATLESKFTDYVNQARLLGGIIGFASASIMLSKSLAEGLKDIVPPSQIRALQRNLNVLDTFTPVQKAAVVESVAKSFNLQLRIATYVVAACVMFSLCSYTRYPSDLLLRKTLGEQVQAGTITVAEAERQYLDRGR